MKPLQSKQHAVNRKAYLERFLAARPQEAVYSGESEFAGDAVEQENRHNEQLADQVQAEIVRCDKYLIKHA